MPRTRLFRLTAALLALLTSLSTPGLAFAHGRVHAHLASEHDGGHSAEPVSHGSHDDVEADHHGDDLDDADSDGRDAHGAWHASTGMGLPSHEHAHAHEIIVAAATSRDLTRVGAANVVAIVEPVVRLSREPLRRIDVAIATNSALLARPGPDTGPPPSPRAPPVH